MTNNLTETLIEKYVGNEVHPYMESMLYDCELRGLQPKSILCYIERIHYLMQYLDGRSIDFTSVTKETIKEYILSLRGKVSPETVNGRIRVYKRFWGHLIEEQLWEKPNPMDGIRQQRVPKKLKNVIGPEDIQKMVRLLDRRSYHGFRGMVIIVLSWDCMLRSKEIRNLKLGDINLKDRLIKVFGKGRERMVPLSIRTTKLLTNFLAKWRNRFPGELLISMTNGKRITERRYHRIITDIAKKAGVEVSPHGIRHSAATWYCRQPGSSLEILRQLLGHSNLNITTNYLHLTPADLAEGYKVLSPGNAIVI